jgi:PHD/YefM family antitoxin component YafN of YafNO toxin-antitoxin module
MTEMEHEVAISHLRDVLGFAVRQVARTGEPIIVRRYKRADVILVPLSEWRRLQRLETDLALAKFTIDDSEDHQPSLTKESA